MNDTEFDAWLTNSSRRPLVMGILNITPDSFSDGGQFFSPDSALTHAQQMVQHGADIIDIGGESTRPGSQPIPPDEQLRRVLPVISTLRSRLPITLSIDTTRSAVAQAALDHGAHIINDISAGRDDPDMFPLAARSHCPIILMHMLGQPASMQDHPTYTNVTAEVLSFLQHRLAAARDAGIDPKNILLDPGLGFGKTAAHNLQLLHHLPDLASLGRPLVVGSSRKRFIAAITGESDPASRIFGSLAAAAWSLTNGAAIIRVHDVEPTVRVVRMIQAIQDAI